MKLDEETNEQANEEVFSRADGKLSPEAKEWIEMWGPRVALQMYRQNAEAAHAIVERGIGERNSFDDTQLLKASLATIGADQRACNLLEKHLCIGTVEELLAATPGELATVPMMGPNTIVAIYASLLKYTVYRVLELEAKQQK